MTGTKAPHTKWHSHLHHPTPSNSVPTSPCQPLISAREALVSSPRAKHIRKYVQQTCPPTPSLRQGLSTKTRREHTTSHSPQSPLLVFVSLWLPTSGFTTTPPKHTSFIKNLVRPHHLFYQEKHTRKMMPIFPSHPNKKACDRCCICCIWGTRA